MTKTIATTRAKPQRAVLKITDNEGTRTCLLNKDAMPGRGDEDDVLALLADQVLAATKINQHTEADVTKRYNAAIAAFHDIAPVGALEGMLATQLIATHMATMDCYAHVNITMTARPTSTTSTR